MSEEEGKTWESSKATLDGVLEKCVRMWLNLDGEADPSKRLEHVQTIRVGLALANRYLRVLRMADDVRQAQANKVLIEESQVAIKELERRLKLGEEHEGEKGS